MVLNQAKPFRATKARYSYLASLILLRTLANGKSYFIQNRLQEYVQRHRVVDNKAYDSATVVVSQVLIPYLPIMIWS